MYIFNDRVYIDTLLFSFSMDLITKRRMARENNLGKLVKLGIFTEKPERIERGGPD
jgi:hypothetical protein